MIDQILFIILIPTRKEGKCYTQNPHCFTAELSGSIVTLDNHIFEIALRDLCMASVWMPTDPYGFDRIQ